MLCCSRAGACGVGQPHSSVPCLFLMADSRRPPGQKGTVDGEGTLHLLLKSIPVVEVTGQNKVTGTWLLGDLTSVSRSLVGWSLLVCNVLL